MLQSVEILPRRRRSKRHAVRIEAGIVCDLWDEPVSLPVRDLSVDGLYLDSELPLEPGTEVVIEIHLGEDPIYLFGRVRRAELRSGDEPGAGMGVELLDVSAEDRAVLADALARQPPSLPRRKVAASHELVWIEALLTYEASTGEVIEVSEALGVVISPASVLDEAVRSARSLSDLMS